MRGVRNTEREPLSPFQRVGLGLVQLAFVIEPAAVEIVWHAGQSMRRPPDQKTDVIAHNCSTVKTKVVIIGAGIGGAALAALLAAQGLEVVLCERNSFVGGKTASYERNGFICDRGIHYTARGSRGPLGEVARRTGADLEFAEPDPVMRMVTPTRCHDLPQKLLSPLGLLRMAQVAGVSPRNLVGALQVFWRLLRVSREPDVARYDSVPLRDFLLRFTDDAGLHNLMNIFTGLLLVVPYDEVSAGEFLWCFSTMAKSASLGYPKGGFGEIAKSYLKACEAGSGQVRLNEPVVSIEVEHGTATGVRTASDLLAADIVVSNVGIRKTVALAGPKHFPDRYRARVAELKDSVGAVGIKYALERSPFDAPIVLYMPDRFDWARAIQNMARGIAPEDFPIFIPQPTFCDPTLAPPGKHIILTGGAVPADLSFSGVADKLLDRIDRKVCSLFPGIEKHIIWKQRANLDFIDAMSGRGAGDVIGLAQTYDQVGENKPDQRTPLKNLYLVGCDAGGRGVGTEQAADSALKLNAMIASDIALRRQ